MLLISFPKAPPRFRAFPHWRFFWLVAKTCAATQGRCATRQTWFLVHAAGSPSVSCCCVGLSSRSLLPANRTLRAKPEAQDLQRPRACTNHRAASPFSWGMCAALAALLAEICGTAPALQHTVRAALKSTHPSCFTPSISRGGECPGPTSIRNERRGRRETNKHRQRSAAATQPFRRRSIKTGVRARMTVRRKIREQAKGGDRIFGSVSDSKLVLFTPRRHLTLNSMFFSVTVWSFHVQITGIQ